MTCGTADSSCMSFDQIGSPRVYMKRSALALEKNGSQLMWVGRGMYNEGYLTDRSEGGFSWSDCFCFVLWRLNY